jgi:hypothetical protein
MSQDVSTNPRAREPLTAPAPIQPWSAESDADKLMDELFSDIDRILEGGTNRDCQARIYLLAVHCDSTNHHATGSDAIPGIGITAKP